jgi:hypothetical protein
VDRRRKAPRLLAVNRSVQRIRVGGQPLVSCQDPPGLAHRVERGKDLMPREKDSIRHDPRHRTSSFARPAATAWYFSQNERSIAPPLGAEVVAR